MSFVAHDWSPDGRRLAGYQQRPDGSPAGVVLYSLDSRQFEKLTDSGSFPRWMSDSRRLLFTDHDKSFLVDAQSRKTRELSTPGPLATLSRDNRSIYYTTARTEADIWLLTLPEPRP